MKSRFILHLAAFCLAAAPLAAQPSLAGKIVNDTYIAASGAFQITIPVLPELGGQLHDNETTVTFEDAFSTHASVGALPMDTEQRWELDLRGLRDYLSHVFSGTVMADLRQRFPEASIESTWFLPDVQGGALLACSLVPGGSLFESKTDFGLMPEEPPVAKHGNLLFVKNGCTFLISSELAERVTEGGAFHKTVAEENALLQKRLLELLGLMTFPEPPPAPEKK